MVSNGTINDNNIIGLCAGRVNMNIISYITYAGSINKDTMTMMIKALDTTLVFINLEEYLEDPIPFYSNHMENTAVFDELIHFVETEF